MKVETIGVNGLRECPFCGGIKFQMIVKDFQTDYKPPYNAEVVCSCGASMKVAKFFDTREKAAEEAMVNWNKRW